ncbi:MAG: Na(+)-translocating NADH-quinone reductase subunit A [Candidatus Hydrogenedentes bacterium]|nr:Na(+)-translocating NADH-quinone reductase subunit A [Candidatus Hydrogenedentota bacterium]
MAVHTIKKGLNLPISGEPVQEIDRVRQPRHVALLADDYVGMKPTMAVAAGDAVKRGQRLFEDKKNPGVLYTAPAAGTVAAVNRGAKRAFQSIVIELNEAEAQGKVTGADVVRFENYTGNDPAGLSRDQIQALLLESGLWTAFRTRPFSKVPAPGTVPHSIFVTAIDTNPLAPSVERVIAGREEDFQRGLICVAKMTEGKTYLCKARGAAVPANPNTGIAIEEFEGAHPAGTVGVHIHRLDPVHREKTVWHIGFQDVIAIGHLFKTGGLDVERVISLAGPIVKKPRLISTRLGASIDDLVGGELKDGESRVISGSVLSGRVARGEVFGYLGRYHQQVSVVREGREREFLGWMAPGSEKFSIINLFVSCLSRGKRFAFDTSTNGSKRAMVPIGMYEKVMPMDILPTHLLRALIVGDLERAEQLGCLELDEEDLALCTFVCPGKYEYGPILRQNLDVIDREG